MTNAINMKHAWFVRLETKLVPRYTYAKRHRINRLVMIPSEFYSHEKYLKMGCKNEMSKM